MASSMLFPIATLFPDATTTFFSCGTCDLSFSIIWYIGSTYRSVLFIGTIIIFFCIFVPVTFNEFNSFNIFSSCSTSESS